MKKRVAISILSAGLWASPAGLAGDAAAAAAPLFAGHPTGVAAPLSGPQGLGGGCRVSTTPMAFGNYDAASSAPRDSQGLVSIRCRGNLRRVRIEVGAGGSHNMQRREMTNGAARLAYNLYLDAARQVIWGDGSQGSQVANVSTQPGRGEKVPVYGRIFPGQRVPGGQYDDYVTITVLF